MYLWAERSLLLRSRRMRRERRRRMRGRRSGAMKSTMRAFLLLVPAVWSLACAGGGTELIEAGVTSPIPADGGVECAASTDWLEDNVIASDGGIIVEQVAYRSGCLKVFGCICRPDDSAP